MPGVRIHNTNPVVWGTTILIPHPGDPLTGRKPKDYHMRLDADGNVIVSETVWERLQQARGSGLTPHQFIVLNEVPDPPHQRIGETPAEQQRVFRQIGEALQELAPPGVRNAQVGPARWNT